MHHMSLDYNFQEFQNVNAKIEKRISITRSCSFGFPYGFCDENRINDFTFVVLFFDPTKRAIGFLFTTDSEKKYKYSLVKSLSSRSASVVARSFFTTYNLNPGEIHGRYEPKKIVLPTGEQIFVIDLKNKVDENEQTEEGSI